MVTWGLFPSLRSFRWYNHGTLRVIRRVQEKELEIAYCLTAITLGEGGKEVAFHKHSNQRCVAVVTNQSRGKASKTTQSGIREQPFSFTLLGVIKLPIVPSTPTVY